MYILLSPQSNRKYFSREFLGVAAGEGVEPSASESKSDVLPVTLSRKNWSRRKESNLRLSIIDRVHCRLCYTAMVDPTRLKLAPHGLKGRCSVTRAPDRKDWLWRKDSNPRWPD